MISPGARSRLVARAYLRDLELAPDLATFRYYATMLVEAALVHVLDDEHSRARRRTGRPRGRPSLAPVIAEIEACFDGGYIDDAGVARIAAIIGRTLGHVTRDQRISLMVDLESVIEQRQRIDWRAFIKKRRYSLIKT